MKTITLTKTDKSLPPIFISDDTPSIPTQQVTIAHTSRDNPRHPRNIQLSNEFIFVKRAGSPPVAMHVDDFIQLCTHVEPKLSWPPLFKQNVVMQGSPAVIESQFETSNPELSESDNVISYQWQQGANDGSQWQDLSDNETFSGCKTNKLSVTNAPGAPTKTLRCLATNGAGVRSSLIITSSAPPVTPAKA